MDVNNKEDKEPSAKATSKRDNDDNGGNRRDEKNVDKLQAKALKDGKLSPAEQRRLRQAQNKASRDINTAEHNGVNGNPLSVAAGLAALTEVLTKDAYDHLGTLGTQLAEGCKAAMDDNDIPGHTMDLGAKPSTAIWRILIPQMKAGIVTAVIFVFIPILGEYLAPQLVGGARGVMIGNLIVNFFSGAQYTRGAAAALLVAALIVVLFVIFRRSLEVEDATRA